MKINWIDPVVLDHQSSGKELLVGSGENDSDTTLSNVKEKELIQ